MLKLSLETESHCTKTSKYLKTISITLEIKIIKISMYETNRPEQ